MPEPARSDDAAGLPRAPGAYALHLVLDEAVTLSIPRLGDPTLAPGAYVYAGSARGPGGIAARVARHLRTDRKVHWHIDGLTARAARIDVRGHPGGRECELVAALLAHGATVPVPGFGSSDCRTCAAHLVRLPG